MPIIKSKDVIEVNQITKDLKKVRDEIDALTESNKKLSDSLQAVKKSNDGTEAKKLADGTDKLTKSTKGLTEIQKQELKLRKQLITSEAKIVASYEAEAQQLAEVKLEQQERNKQLKQAAQANKVATSSLKGMRVELSKLTDKYDKLSKKERENIKVGGQLQSQINKTSKALKAAENATDRNQRSVGKYSDALKGLGRQLIGALGITAGLTLLVDQFKKAAERIGILNKLTNQLKGTFDITTKEAKRLASQINAMAENFEDVDAKALQSSLTAIVKTFDDLSEQEALDLIQEGFQKGSNNSGEFLDILKEYPVQFKAAGIDAQTMFAIINQQVKQGIYSDKGVDAIKEGGLRLRENTKAVQEALKPFDDYTKQQIKLAIESGNSFEAIQLVSKGLTDTKLTAAQTQAVIADVFGGAGEDAGLNYIKTLQDVQTNLEGVSKETSIVSEANLRLSESYNNFLLSVESGNGIISETIASYVDMGSELLELAKTFNETNLQNKLKILANGFLFIAEKALKPFVIILEALGVEMPKLRFEITNTSEALRLQQIEQTNSVRLTKEQKEANEKQTKTVKKLTDNTKALAEAEKKRQDQLKSSQTVLENQIKLEKELADELAKELEVDEELTDDQDKLDAAQELEDGLVDVQDKGAEDRKKINDEETANFIKNGLLVKEVTTAAGQQIGDLMAQGLLTFKAFGKILLKTTLDLVQRQVNIYLVSLLAREIGTKGAIGLGTFAILSLAINAALGAAKTAVSSFAEGGEVHGPGTGTSDSIDAKLSDGEFVVKSAAYSDSHDIINAVNDGIVTDKNINDYAGKHDNSELANLFVQNNNTTKQLLQAMLNMGYVVPGPNNTVTEKKADGSSPKTFPLK